MAEYPPLLAAGTGLFGARLWRLTAGRRVIAAFGCGKYGVGCRRPANPAIWAVVSDAAADKTGLMRVGVREDEKLPQTNAATSAKQLGQKM